MRFSHLFTHTFKLGYLFIERKKTYLMRNVVYVNYYTGSDESGSDITGTFSKLIFVSTKYKVGRCAF